jgi:hypothetical protein
MYGCDLVAIDLNDETGSRKPLLPAEQARKFGAELIVSNSGTRDRSDSLRRDRAARL